MIGDDDDRIRFEEWTDQQLVVGSRFEKSSHYADLMAEIQRRKDEGTWTL